MQISMYRASVPVFARNLRNLIGILRKAEASATERKIDQGVLLGYRLAPDMFPLTRQVQIATDMAKGCVSRLAGVEIPAYDDKEATFGELIARLEKCITYLESFKPAQIDGTEDNSIGVPMGGQTQQIKGLDYLQRFITPNFYFHLTMAYAILRHNGVDVGKRDFLGMR